MKWFNALLSPGYVPPYIVHGGILENAAGAFAVFPLAGMAAVGFTISIVAVRRAARERIIKPYLSGLQTETPGMFTGPLNRPVRAEASNYNLSSTSPFSQVGAHRELLQILALFWVTSWTGMVLIVALEKFRKKFDRKVVDQQEPKEVSLCR